MQWRRIIPQIYNRITYFAIGWPGIFWVYWDKQPIVAIYSNLPRSKTKYLRQPCEKKPEQIWLLNLGFDFAWRTR